MGSGISGLGCAWALSKRHQVTLYEAAERLGMDAHALEVPSPSGPVRIDVPMRVFFPEYYPNLAGMYREAGVEFEKLDHTASFSSLSGALYFRFANYRVGSYAVPFLTRMGLVRPRVLRLGAEIGWMFLRLNQSPPPLEAIEGKTVAEFFDDYGVSTELRDKFLMPAYAGICTCSYEALAHYPARVIVDYITGGVVLASMRRAKLGVGHVVNTLAQACASVRLGAPIRRLERLSEGVRLIDGHGHADTFDHVVLATQANQALEILGAEATSRERAILEAFRYETFGLVIHADPALAPARRAWWAPVNYLLQEGSTAPMATLPLNTIYPGLEAADPVFQTWNPLLEPDPEKVFSRSDLQRPVVNRAALDAIAQLSALQDEPNRRVWMCGSYAAYGVPLQESAVSSAFSVAARLGAGPSWTLAP